MKPLEQLLAEADQQKVAVGHFNICDLVALKAIYSAARELNVPVLVGVSEGERDFIGVHEIAALILQGCLRQVIRPEECPGRRGSPQRQGFTLLRRKQHSTAARAHGSRHGILWGAEHHEYQLYLALETSITAAPRPAIRKPMASASVSTNALGRVLLDSFPKDQVHFVGAAADGPGSLDGRIQSRPAPLRQILFRQNTYADVPRFAAARLG